MPRALMFAALLLGCDPASTPVDGGAESPLDVGPETDVGREIDAGDVPEADVGSEVDVGSEADAGSDLAPVEHVTIVPPTDECADGPTDYGRHGPVTAYDRYELPNPGWTAAGALPLVVFSPDSAAPERPVLFYSHAFGGTEWRRMLGLLELLVSHDYVVVFVPYPTTGTTVCGRYDTLEGGFAEAVARLATVTRMDTSRVGFIGHSFGGGASPSMARVGLIERGWGSTASFVFSSAPWYVYRMDEPGAWDALGATRLVLMVYADDTVNDHRMAIDQIYARHPGTRSFLRLRSDAEGECTLTADHGTPTSHEGIDALDRWGLWRHAHALADCTLRDEPAACAVIEDPSMGHFLPGGRAIEPIELSTTPEPTLPTDDYTFPIGEELPCTRAD